MVGSKISTSGIVAFVILIWLYPFQLLRSPNKYCPYLLFFWFLAILAAIFVGLGKGGLPVIASLAVPSLSLVMSPITAAGLLLPVYIVSDIFALSAYRRDNDKQVVIIAIVGMTAGVFIGWLTAHIMIEWAVTFLIGLMGSVFALHSILDKSPQVDRGQILNKKREMVLLIRHLE